MTVLMPVLNGERHLAQAIESILGQSCTDFELVLVNDGSTDRTAEIIASYRDDRIVVIENGENLGLNTSLGLAVRRARGDLLARLDADDVAHRERLARQIAVLDAQPAVGMVSTWFTEVDDDGRLLGRGQPPADPAWIRWRLLFHNPIPPSTTMLRRCVLESSPADESLTYAMDYELWCRIARTSLVTTVEDFLVDYRHGVDSMTASSGDAVADEPRRIAVAEMRHVAVAGNVEPEQFDTGFHADAQALLWRPESARPELDALGSVRKLFRLHDAFCRMYRLPDTVARRQRRDVRRRIGGNLARLRRERLHGEGARGAAVLVAAAVLSHGELLRRRTRADSKGGHG